MQIQIVKDQKVWEDFVLASLPRSGAFLHAWAYGEMGAQRLGVYEAGELVAVAMVTEMPLRFGWNYALIQKGPIVKEGVDVGRVVSLIGEEMKVTFVRFEPVSNHPQPLLSRRARSGFAGEKEGGFSSQIRLPPPFQGGDKGVVTWAKKTIHISPEETLLLDLTKTEDDLLAQMHQKTRYNIRLAQKKNVEVRELTREEWSKAWKIFEETALRDGFRLHARARYEAWLERFSGARLVGAFYEGDLLAVNLQVDAFGTRTYLHGASSNQHREVMAPYALHWREIRDAKQAGLSTYDFWGVSDTHSAWKGITRFKRGFGGERHLSSGTFDLVQSSWKYRVYRLLRALRRRGN